MERLFSLKSAGIVTFIVAIASTIVMYIWEHNIWWAITWTGIFMVLNMMLSFVKTKLAHLYDSNPDGFCYLAYIIQLIISVFLILGGHHFFR